jgi:hypothetical protein
MKKRRVEMVVLPPLHGFQILNAHNIIFGNKGVLAIHDIIEAPKMSLRTLVNLRSFLASATCDVANALGRSVDGARLCKPCHFFP